MEQSNAACGAITVHFSMVESSGARNFPVRIPTCSIDYLCREPWNQFGSSPQSTSQARNALAARRFVSPTESKKLKSQPALRLVHSKTNHLAINYSLPAFTNAASIPAARELLCDPPVFLLTLLFGSRASSRAVAFFAPSSPTSISSFQHLSSA